MSKEITLSYPDEALPRTMIDHMAQVHQASGLRPTVLIDPDEPKLEGLAVALQRIGIATGDASGGGGAGIGTEILAYGDAPNGQASPMILEESPLPETYPFFARIAPAFLATRALVSAGQNLDLLDYDAEPIDAMSVSLQVEDGAAITATLNIGSGNRAFVTANTSADVNVAIAAGDGATGIAQVEDGVFNGILLDGAFAVVEDAQVITIGAETFTFTVVDNEITAIVVGP